MKNFILLNLSFKSKERFSFFKNMYKSNLFNVFTWMFFWNIYWSYYIAYYHNYFKCLVKRCWRKQSAFIVSNNLKCWDTKDEKQENYVKHCYNSYNNILSNRSVSNQNWIHKKVHFCQVNNYLTGLKITNFRFLL